MTIWAAVQFHENGETPPAYKPLATWVYTLGSIYIILGYLSIGYFGGALIQANFLASWIAWLSVVFGLAGTFSIITGFPIAAVDDQYTGNSSIANIPLWILLLPLIYGIGLIIHAF